MSNHTSIATRDQTARRHPIIGRLARFLNPRMLAFAERLHFLRFAIIHHRGRRSGRSYTTPVSARPTPDGFVVPLTFGMQADWFRNIQAAGGCVIQWKGIDYPVGEAEIIDWASARPAFNLIERALVLVIGVKQFARLHHTQASTLATAKEGKDG